MLAVRTIKILVYEFAALIQSTGGTEVSSVSSRSRKPRKSSQ